MVNNSDKKLHLMT